MTITFSIENDRKYLPGEHIQGYLLLDLDRSLSAEFFDLTLQGKCKTQIWRNKNGKHIYTSGFQVEEEVFLEQKIVLWTRTESNTKLVGPSVTKYDFDFLLPSDLPATVSRFKHSTVTYKLKANLLRTGLILAHLKSEHTLFVNSSTSLSRDQMLIPFQPNVSCCCRNFGSLDLAVKLQSSVFTPGETIGIDLQIKNPTNLPIHFIRTRLKETRRYTAQSFSACKKQVIGNSFEKLPSPIYGDFSLQTSIKIPESEMSTIQLGILQIYYKLYVSIGFKKILMTDVTVKVPIKVFNAFNETCHAYDDTLPPPPFPGTNK